jgi:N-acetylglucosamine kinase-like BadF-type ATPase
MPSGLQQDNAVYFLGIDSGGTSTEVAVGDGGHVLARDIAPSAKVTKVGQQVARANLEQAIFHVLSMAGIAAQQVSHVCVGMSGISVEGAEEWMHSNVSSLLGGNAKLHVVGDEEVAHFAAFSGEPGVVVISGTGSIAIGKSPQGQTARCGGWGPRFSDEGSATWIGELAIRKSIRSHDRDSDTQLLAAILSDRGMKSIEELIDPAKKVNASALFPLIVDAAHKGDMIAWYVLSEAGRELADIALAISQKLRLVRGTVCGVGGVFRNSGLVRSSFRAALAANAAHLTYDERLVEPVLGALQMAREAAKA